MAQRFGARCVFFQAEDGIRDVERSRGLGDVYKRQDPSSPFRNRTRLTKISATSFIIPVYSATVFGLRAIFERDWRALYHSGPTLQEERLRIRKHTFNETLIVLQYFVKIQGNLRWHNPELLLSVFLVQDPGIVRGSERINSLFPGKFLYDIWVSNRYVGYFA